MSVYRISFMSVYVANLGLWSDNTSLVPRLFLAEERAW